MNKPILFTFITITYNAEKTLGRTLQSVSTQTYPHVEHILIDGASKDGTLRVAQELGGHLDKLISEPDGGLYDAMNKGLELATGDYVCFLNAGDKLHTPDTLERIVGEIEFRQKQNLPGVVYGDTDIVDDNGCFLRPRHLTPPERLNWKSFKQGMLVCHQAFYARRDLCLKYDMHYRFSADFDWCIRVLKQTADCHRLPFVVADYLEEGVTTRNHRASLIERFRIMCRHYGFFTTLCHHLWFVVRAVMK